MRDTMGRMWRSVRNVQPERVTVPLADLDTSAGHLVPQLETRPARSASMLQEDAEFAVRASDWHAADAAFKALGRLRPGDAGCVLGRAAACRALDRSVPKPTRSLRGVPGSAIPMHRRDRRQPGTERATTFADWEQALARWRQAREEFPHIPVIWASQAAMLQILGRLDEAEALVAEALELFPGKCRCCRPAPQYRPGNRQ